MKFALSVIAACLASAFLNEGAFAQSAITLTQEDPHGYFWDAGNSQWGGNFAQVYQAFVPNESTQAFTWTPVANGFTVCSTGICLSDNGLGGVLMSQKSDVFTITKQSEVLDVTTGKYVTEPANPANGTQLLMSATPMAWTFAVAGSGSSTTGTTGGGTTGGGGSGSTGGGGSITGHVNIMPLGDSITEGYAADGNVVAQGGYRCPLSSLLGSTGISFSFVGNSAALEPGWVTQCSEVNWEGHGGFTIGAIQGVIDGDGSVSAMQPNIVLLLGGTNDVAQGQPSATAGELTSILNDIFARDPNAWVIVSTIPPINPSAPSALPQEAGWASQVPGVNAQIKAVQGQFPRTTLIDYYSAVVGNVGANIGPDGVHPTGSGYAILAGLWADAITKHLSTGK
jgi:lysophospholipase L1-like esterase